MITFDDIFKTGFEYLQNFYITDKVSGVSTDTRTINKGDAFFALVGEKFDGHKFIKQAFEKGASLAVVNYDWFIKNRDNFKDNPILVVHDTVKALGQYAKNHRQKYSIPVIAVAGSNGKTTTKDMIASILSKKYNVLKTEGNLNNHIGVPLMIFKINKNTEIAVIEIGTNHIGEIEYLCNILNPNYGLITNIGKEHLEYFRDLETVAKEETSLYNYLYKMKGFAFVNYDDDWLREFSCPLKNKVSYSFYNKSYYRGKIQNLKNQDKHVLSVFSKGKKVLEANINIPGKHNLMNALASTVVGLEFGVKKKDIKLALEGFKPSFGRMELLEINGIKIIKDCYNSNPDSLRVGLETFAKMKSVGNKYLVIGDMLEVGERSPEEHRLVGEFIKRLGFEYIFLYGPFSKYIMKELQNIPRYCKHYDDKNLLVKDLKTFIKEGDSLFVKGSRGMQMETVIDSLLNK